MRHITGLTVILSIILAALVNACAPEPQPTHLPRPATQTRAPFETPEAVTPVMPRPTTRTITPDDDADSLAGCPARPAGSSAAQYALNATLDWLAHTVRVEQDVAFYNDTGQPLDTIVFNVEPHREPDNFTLERVTLSGKPMQDFTLSDARLAVPLRTTLQAGCRVDLTLKYTLTLPPIANGYRHGHFGYWGYNQRQINLGMWFPLVAAFDTSQGWITPAFHMVGEHYALRAGDFALNLEVRNAPEGIRLAGPGTVTQENDHLWHIELGGARELTVSLSDAFHTLTTVTGSGVEIELYYLYDAGPETLNAPRHALYVAADALALYEELYGPYHRERLVVVEGDFPDGMEFSGLVFVSEAWFRTWSGVPNDWLTIITAHEVAHQWWYDAVGNHQGQQPYLDEALAIYSEVLFLERYYPEHVTWWWDFRVNAYMLSGHVDASVYDFSDARSYINAVYLRGALLMRELRDTLGDDTFFAWLQAYADNMMGKLAAPQDFWGTLGSVDYAKTLGVRQTYLRNPNVLLLNDTIP